MQTRNANNILIREMMNWFDTERQLKDWAGPDFRYPFTEASFIEDLKLDKLAFICLVSSDQEFLAFGQYYQRLNKCHFGRLLVSPKHRGKGIVSSLIKELSVKGKKDLGVSAFSLFVSEHNLSAIKAYKKIGFKVRKYPEDLPLDNCIYMVASEIT